MTALYLLLGWAGVKSVGQLRDTGVLLVACGGAAYTLGGMYSILPMFLPSHCVLLIVFVWQELLPENAPILA